MLSDQMFNLLSGGSPVTPSSLPDSPGDFPKQNPLHGGAQGGIARMFVGSVEWLEGVGGGMRWSLDG